MESARQVGALPVRQADDGGLMVLLVTSRDTGRWVIPKGWPSKRLTDPNAAAREALQEAGVTGKIKKTAIGTYRYRKIDDSINALVEVSVFLLTVRKEKKNWSEKRERERAWFAVEAAARKVREPRLKALILALKPAAKQAPTFAPKDTRARLPVTPAR
ncbi:MAG: NUDIX hydrolase [Hyphomicrobium sp.]